MDKAASIVESQQIATCLSGRCHSQRYLCARNSRTRSLHRPCTASLRCPAGPNNAIGSAFGRWLGGQRRLQQSTSIVARAWSSSSRGASVGPSISDLRIVEKVGSMAVQTVQTPSTVSLEAPKVSRKRVPSHITCLGTSATHHCTIATPATPSDKHSGYNCGCQWHIF